MALYGLSTVLVLRIALSFLSYSRFCSLMERPQSWRSIGKCGFPSPDDIASSVRFGGRYVPRSTCLVQCHAAQLLYAWAGKTTTLHIGVVRGVHSQLCAHAWLELEGNIVLGQIDGMAFTEFKEHPI